MGELEQPLRSLADQLQSHLGALIGLAEHGGTGLHQHVPLREVRGFLSDIDIGDVADRGLQVRLIRRQRRAGEVQAALLGAVFSAHGRHVLDRRGDRAQREAGASEAGHTRRRYCPDTGARVRQRRLRHRDRLAGAQLVIGVYAEGLTRRGGEQGHAVEGLRSQVRQLALELGELVIVVGFV